VENKDANDALMNNPEELAAAVGAAQVEAARAEELIKEEYIRQDNAHRVDDFLQHCERNAKTPVLSTGLDNMNALLCGGLYPGLYIIGAKSSDGKTAIALQIANHIAQTRKTGEHPHGRDVLFFCLEMTAHELMARDISRHTYEAVKGTGDVINSALSTRDVLNNGCIFNKDGERSRTGERQKAMEGGVEAYKKYAAGIYTVESGIITGDGASNVDDIVDRATRHAKLRGAPPVVIVDYLQLLKPTPEEVDKRIDHRSYITNAVLKLKSLSGVNGLYTPVIVISSFNRGGYGRDGESGMEAFKESGEIEYTADVLIKLRGRYENEATDKNPDTMKPIRAAGGAWATPLTAEVLKNRNGRRTVGSDRVGAYFSFYGMYNYFEENGGSNDSANTNQRR